MSGRQPLDEARFTSGEPRPEYHLALAALNARDLRALEAEMVAGAAACQMVHGAGAAEHPFPFDPVPRIVRADEWRALAEGCVQRVRALDAFMSDVHEKQEALRAGVVPREVIESCPWFERDLVGAPPPAVGIGVAGPDVVRGADGRLVVLEDNVRTPTMMAYAVAGRRLVRRVFGSDAAPGGVDAVLRDALCTVLRASAPWTAEPFAVILTEGAGNALRWEIEELGRLLGIAVLKPADVRVRAGRLVTAGEGRTIDVIWRRTSEERLRDDAGRLNALGQALIEPLTQGRLAVVNAFGTGVADDKRVFARVGDLIRFFLGEEPKLDSAPTYELASPEERRIVLERLDELVVKPRDGSGGQGVFIGPTARRSDIDAIRRAVQADPGRWIAQETVALSTHPIVADGKLEPRHVDLRPYVVATPAGFQAIRLAFCRFAPTAGDMVVNCSRGGGGKDVWIEGDAGIARDAP
ncbi:MAG: circularly permuted type 2 ATP-grasp protein [Actinomycetota bacterium]|nr:circularly permuted type 2 ATP-grasp protein [Actinomycetota bacterium]